MTEAPVAVVIPAHNAAPFIAETLDSLRRQTVADWRAIVVDDGSTDGTGEVVTAVGDPRIELHRQDRGGVSAARNAGLARVTEDVVLFLDADDVLFPDHLARLLAALAADGDAVMAYGEVETFTPGEASGPRPPRPDRRRPAGLFPTGFLLYNPASTPGCVLVRTRVAREAGGFAEDLVFGEDWEFFARLAARGPVLYLPGAPVLRYRVHPASAARRLAANVQLLLDAVDRIHANPAWRDHLDPAVRDALHVRARANAMAYTATECLKAGNWAAARTGFRGALRLHHGGRRIWILWACAELGILPRPVRARLK